MSFNESYYNKMGHSVPCVAVRELSSTEDTISCGTPPPPFLPFAPRLSPRPTGDNKDIGDGLSLTSAETSMAASEEKPGHVFNRDYEVGTSGEIKAVGSDMSLLPIEVELIEAERARERVFARALSKVEAAQAGPSKGYSGGAPPDHRGAHGFRCAWHGLSLAATRTSNASVPDGCECRERDSIEIIGRAAPAASQIPSRPPAALVSTNSSNSSSGGISITQYVQDSRSLNMYYGNCLDWWPNLIGGVSPYHRNKRYLDKPLQSHDYQTFRPEESAAHVLSAWELEKQRQAIAPTERDSLESMRSLELCPVSILGTAMPGRVLTPSVISIHSISPPASVYNAVPKSTFMIDNSAVDEPLRDVRGTGSVTGYDCHSANRERGRSRERRDLFTHNSIPSLSHFTHLTVDTSLKTKVACLIIICVFLALSGTVLWLVSKKKMHIAPGIFSLFVLGVATLKLGSECLRAFGLRKKEVSDLERGVGVGQKNVASLI